MKLILLGFFLMMTLPAKAEYRAFLLEITTAAGEKTQVISTLDPDQYPGYYPLDPTDRITYTQTWTCRGRTSHKPICPPPTPVQTEAEAP